MRGREWMVVVIAGVILRMVFVALGVTFFSGTQGSAFSTSDVNDVLNLMLNSHDSWKTARGEALITFYSPDKEGIEQSFLNSFEISLPDMAYFESKDATSKKPVLTWISDGENIYQLDYTDDTNGKMTVGSVPGYTKDTSMIPASVEKIERGVSYPHPLTLAIPFPVSECLFPQYFPQGLGTFELLGEEKIIGRNTWIIKFSFTGHTDTPMQESGYYTLVWVDQAIGVILKYESYNPTYPKGKDYSIEFSEFETDILVNTARMTNPKP